MIEYITKSIQDSICAKEQLLSDKATLSTIESVAEQIYNIFKQGGKVLLCGNGGSAADAQHIAAEFVGRFICERQGLNAMALTTDSSILTAVSNDYGFDTIFERQTRALGHSGDMLIGISTSGNSENVARALRAASQIGMTTVGLLGGDGGKCLPLCQYPIIAKAKEAARVQESHILIGHILCGVVDCKIRRDEQ